MTDVHTTETEAPAAERNPLYAMAGAADAAVATLRELPTRVSGVVGDDELRADVRRRFNELPADVKAWRASFPDLVLQAQGRAADLPQRLRERVETASREAVKTYGELSVRGEGVVERLRGQYGPAVHTVVANVRGYVAGAADEVAEVTEKAADTFSQKRKSR